MPRAVLSSVDRRCPRRRVLEAGLAVALAFSSCGGGAALADLCGVDDRVPITEGAAVRTATARLSAEQVEAIRRAVYAVRPKIGLGVAPACTGTAISGELLLTAGHCVTRGGLKAYQKHLEPMPKPVDLTLLYHVKDKRSGEDLAIYGRKSGTFQDYIPVEPEFDFTGADPDDRFGFPGFTYEMWNVFTWRQRKLMFSPVSPSRIGDHEVRFELRPCDRGAASKRVEARVAPGSASGDSAPATDPRWCQVLFCADFFDGNSGSPMLRFHHGNGAETITVVAVGTITVKGSPPDNSLNAVAVPVALLRDVLPRLAALRKEEPAGPGEAESRAEPPR